MMDVSQQHKDVDQTPLDERLERFRREARQKEDIEAREKGKTPPEPCRPLAVTRDTPLEERLRLAREQCKDEGKNKERMYQVRKPDLIVLVNKIVRMPFEEYCRLPIATKVDPFPSEWPSHVPQSSSSEVGMACAFIRAYYTSLGKSGHKLDKAEFEDALSLIEIISRPLVLMSRGFRKRSYGLMMSSPWGRGSMDEKYCILPEDTLDFRLEVGDAEVASPRSPLSRICLVSVKYYADAMNEANSTGNEVFNALHVLGDLGFCPFGDFKSQFMYDFLLERPGSGNFMRALPPYINGDQASFMKECFDRGVLASYLMLVRPWGLIWESHETDDEGDDEGDDLSLLDLLGQI